MLIMDSMPNVLVAMKDESMMQMVRDMLRGCSVENIGVHTSLRNAKAVLRAHARKWDIFLIDSGFPEAISEIGAICEEMGPHVKILYMVSMPTTKEEVVRAMRTGINGFIGAPFSQFT
ncbi:MAG: hypothetical protein V3U53_05510, partial [bacterium]